MLTHVYIRLRGATINVAYLSISKNSEKYPETLVSTQHD